MANSGHNGEWRAWSHEDWTRIVRDVAHWSVWYSDGSVVRSTEMSWADAPRDGVQVVMVVYDDGRRLKISNRDEYTMRGEAATKLGEEIEFDKFSAILQTAMRDKWRGPTI